MKESVLTCTQKMPCPALTPLTLNDSGAEVTQNSHAALRGAATPAAAGLAGAMGAMGAMSAGAAAVSRHLVGIFRGESCNRLAERYPPGNDHISQDSPPWVDGTFWVDDDFLLLLFGGNMLWYVSFLEGILYEPETLRGNQYNLSNLKNLRQKRE